MFRKMLPGRRFNARLAGLEKEIGLSLTNSVPTAEH